MAGRIIYLEVDDEITSAAARIRATEASRIAVVLPYGSRVATSRINFRLLSRDALEHEKRLSIVSGDPATRALAASAGLPVFASVAEYESSLTGLEDELGGGTISGPRPVVPVVPSAAAAGTAAAAAGAGAAVTTAVPPVAETAPSSDGTLGLVVPDPTPPPGDTIRTTVPRDHSWSDDRGALEPAKRPAGGVGPRTTSRGTGFGVRTPWLVGGAILALAVLVGGVGLYLLLPSAHIVVTPRTERLGPLDVSITADIKATQPDPAAAIVPAKQVSVPVSVHNTFPATGKRVQLTKATGTVRFQNLDPTSSNRIVAGSIVRTAPGVRFRTAVTITVPKAELVGLMIFPANASVSVTAVDGGPDGNVDPNTVVIVPNGENPLFLKVANPVATTGGTSQEFKRVTQDDVDGAVAALNASLQEAFAEALADPSLETGGATVFPATGQLGPSTPTADPATFVGQEVATFALGMSATGTVIAADTAPLKGIAETHLKSAVKADHTLVPSSVEITIGDAIVTGQTVTFPVRATADEIANLQPAALKAMVLGKPVAEAKAILEGFGQVEISVSPDWSGSVPSFESRVDLTVQQAVPIETPGPSGSSTP